MRCVCLLYHFIGTLAHSDKLKKFLRQSQLQFEKSFDDSNDVEAGLLEAAVFVHMEIKKLCLSYDYQ